MGGSALVYAALAFTALLVLLGNGFLGAALTWITDKARS